MTQGIPHNVGRVFRGKKKKKRLPYNPVPSVQAKIECCGLIISSHKEVNMCELYHQTLSH